MAIPLGVVYSCFCAVIAVMATESIDSAKSEIFTIGPFTKNVCCSPVSFVARTEYRRLGEVWIFNLVDGDLVERCWSSTKRSTMR